MINSLGFAQNKVTLPKLSATPHFGISWASPPKVALTSGSLELKPNIFQNFFLGNTLTSNGENKYFFKVSNNIGIDLNYSLNNTWQLCAGLDRFLLVNTLKDPDPIKISSDYEYGKWFFANKFSSYCLGLSRNLRRTFIQTKLYYANTPQNAIDEGKGVLVNGNGLLREKIIEPKNSFLVSAEIGLIGHNDFDFLNKLSLGLLLPISSYAQDELIFVRNAKPIATNRLSFRQAAIFFKVETPITLWKGSPGQNRNIDKKVNSKIEEIVVFEGMTINDGDKLVLKNIRFEQSKADLLPESINELNQLSQFLLQYPYIYIELLGHTSNEGDRNENKRLSLERAMACKRFLLNKGVKATRIGISGKGPDEPISETNQSLNRRVEVRFIKMK